MTRAGYGRTLNELATLGYENLIGFNFSEGMIVRGKREFPSLELRLKTGDLIEMPDESVDAVILLFTTMNGNKSNGFYYIGSK